MKNLLLSERWRPKKLEDIILLPRIKEIFENGLTQNVILYGHFGTGKTTLARILIGKYLKNSAHIELNSSFYTSIDTLRNIVDDFCSKVYMGFDLDDTLPISDIKYVFLDEFEKTSMAYQDALKAYIEEYSTKNVRFILTTNHINKVSAGIKSRLVKVNFDCQSPEEEKYLKKEIYKRITETICVKEDFTIPKEDLFSIISKKFPDMREILIDVDNYKQTGIVNASSSSVDIKTKYSLYNLVFDKSKTYEDIYDFIMSNFGPEKVDELINLFGTQFTEWSIENNKSVEKLFEVAHNICEYNRLLEYKTDPVIVGISFIGKIKNIF
jgi:DNA polymerase III delta prime subunit